MVVFFKEHRGPLIILRLSARLFVLLGLIGGVMSHLDFQFFSTLNSFQMRSFIVFYKTAKFIKLNYDDKPILVYLRSADIAAVCTKLQCVDTSNHVRHNNVALRTGRWPSVSGISYSM